MFGIFLFLPLLVVALAVISLRSRLKPSSIIGNFRDGLRNSPAVGMLGLLAAGLATYHIIGHQDLDLPATRQIIRQILGLWLGMLACAVSYVYTASRKQKNIIPLGLALILSIVIFLIMRHEPESLYQLHFILMHLVLAIALILAPGWTKSEGDNLITYTSSLVSVFAGVICIVGLVSGGLSAAYGALYYLLEVKIPPETYAVTFIWSSLFLAPVIFMGMLPDTKQGERVEVSNSIIHASILAILTVIYLAILYVYGLKILFSWELPKGMVGWLVCSFSAFGLLAWLASVPQRDSKSMIGRYHRSFFFLLLPLIPLLVVAVFQRVDTYGITEARYFLIAITAWLIFLSIGFTAFRWRDVRIPYFSLGVLIALATFGPQSAPEVAWRSQEHRLREILASIGVSLESASRAKAGVTREVSHQISSILDYMSQRHGRSRLKSIFVGRTDITGEFGNSDMEDHTNGIFAYMAYQGTDITPKIMVKLGLEYVGPYELQGASKYFSWHRGISTSKQLHFTAGYDFAHPFFNPTEHINFSGKIPNTLNSYINATLKGCGFNLQNVSEGREVWSEWIDFCPFVLSIKERAGKNHGEIPPELQEFLIETDKFRLAFYPNNIHGTLEEPAKLNSINGIVFIQIKSISQQNRGVEPVSKGPS